MSIDASESGELDRLSERRDAILRAVIQGYISTSRPVGSGAVTSENAIDVSPATVRKELSALEDEGFLQQPHTSAGRIPTEKGYRYFVDALMQPADLQGQQAERIHEFFTRTHGELEKMLKQTSTLLANLTHYAAVVVGPEPDVATIKSAQIVSLGPQVALLVVVLSNGAVERRTLEFAAEVDDDVIADAGRLLAAAIVGQSVAGAVLVDLADTIADSAGTIAVQALHALQHGDASAGRLYVGGQSSVAEVFDATETVQEVLTILERQLLVSSLIRDVLDRGMRVAIGTETGLQHLNECSIVVAPYLIEGEEAGSIGVLGPQRMNYAQALATVAIVSDGLTAHLSDR